MLSLVRLGIALKILNGVPLERVNELFVLAQPAHTQKRAGRELPEEERDRTRASFLRRKFGAN